MSEHAFLLESSTFKIALIQSGQTLPKWLGQRSDQLLGHCLAPGACERALSSVLWVLPLVSRMTMAFSNPFPLTAVTTSDGSFMSSFLKMAPILSALSARCSSSKTCFLRNYTNEYPRATHGRLKPNARVMGQRLDDVICIYFSFPGLY